MQTNSRHLAYRSFGGRYTHRIIVLVAAARLAGCTGQVGDFDDSAAPGGAGAPTPGSAAGGAGAEAGAASGGGGSSTGGSAGSGPMVGAGAGPGSSTTPTGEVVPVDANAAGPRPLARLSRSEYNNTVRDLLGDTTKPADSFPDDKPDDFLFRRPDVVATQDAELLQSAAASLAASATSATKLNALVGCATADEACARQFVKNFGLKAYRRPVTAAESERLIALYSAARGKLALPFGDAVSLLLQAMLQSPAFLYHWERAPDDAAIVDGAVVRLSPYEAASRLSFFVWGSTPDDNLIQAALQNRLVTSAQLEAQATRMLADPKAQDTVAAFFTELLELDLLVDSRPKDTTLYPATIYPTTIVPDILAETAAFTKYAVFVGDGTLATMLGADYSFVNASLAKIYGQTAQGTALQKVTLNPSQRLGLLTQTGFLALNGAGDGSHPVRRGKAIVTKFLCLDLPPPPQNVPAPAPPSAGGTTRQRFTAHDQQPCTGACHQMMDPIGFAFEHYDGIGKWRTTDNGGMVDSNTVVPLDGQKVTVADAPDLVKALAASPTVQSCMATQWLRFALGRNETDADGQALYQARTAFAKSKRFQDLIVGIASSRSFQYRTPASGEVLP
jgi:hypothetical protein